MGQQAVGFLQGTVAWIAGSIIVNPSDQTVVADTGPLTAGNYLFGTTVACTVAPTYDIQERDASNTVTNVSQRRFAAAGNDDFLFPNKIFVAEQERLRIIMQGGATGTLQASIWFMESGR